MEYKQFYVEGLFGLYNHTIDFSSSAVPEKRASIIMIYGKNGIGKTTILRMIEGLMELDFTIFREVKFTQAFLKFTNNETIIVKSTYNSEKTLQNLTVQYKNVKVQLDPLKTGTINDVEKVNQKKIQELYDNDLQNFHFEFIDTERLIKKNLKEEMNLHERLLVGKTGSKIEKEKKSKLSEKVKSFITESQIYNTQYFSKDEPELFEKILTNIENPISINVLSLKNRITQIVKTEEDFQIDRFGIARERWDRKKLFDILTKEQKNKIPSLHKLTVINSYLEVLESRNHEKSSLAERLLNFESILNEFLLDKKIKISKDKGIEIISFNDDNIAENKLSTGEYHLLYLTVLALCTTVQGTVIAIDEPEMSMHINWQNKLIKALLKISSKANPQFIFATHSPDIAANYSNSLQTTPYVKDRKVKA